MMTAVVVIFIMLTVKRGRHVRVLLGVGHQHLRQHQEPFRRPGDTQFRFTER